MSDKLTDVERILLQLNGQVPRLLFVLVGPSGVGKNTIIRNLLANNEHMDRIRTYTTRAPRPDETPNEQYHFVTFEEFRELALAGKLMEANEDNVGHDVYGAGSLYSMPEDLFWENPPEKHLIIAEVDIQGMRLLRERVPDCVTIFVGAPPVDLEQRIRERPDQTMDDFSFARRMITAKEQVQSAGEFDFLVLNEHQKLDATIKAIKTIIAAERSRVRYGLDLQKIFSPEDFGQGIKQNSSS